MGKYRERGREREREREREIKEREDRDRGRGSQEPSVPQSPVASSQMIWGSFWRDGLSAFAGRCGPYLRPALS